VKEGFNAAACSVFMRLDEGCCPWRSSALKAVSTGKKRGSNITEVQVKKKISFNYINNGYKIEILISVLFSRRILLILLELILEPLLHMEGALLNEAHGS